MSLLRFPLPKPPSDAEEAARWIVRIDHGPLSADERRELTAWLQARPERRDLLDEHALLWAKAGGLAATAGTRRADAAPRPVRRARRAWIPAFAAVAVASIGIAAAWRLLAPVAPDAGLAFNQHYSNGVGRPLTLPLPDGSRIVLNSASEIRVAFGRDGRHIVLVQGEARFDVAKDATRPFDVQAGRTTARAVGTAFSVRLLAAEASEVMVSEGEVDVSVAGIGRPGMPAARLGASQRAIASTSAVSVARLSPSQLARATGWAEGGIAFREERLASVLAEVNRYMVEPVRASDPAAADALVSGYLRVDDPLGFVQALATNLGLHLQRMSSSSAGRAEWVMGPAATLGKP